MKITGCEVRVRKHPKARRAHSDALQSYPGAGAVYVDIHTDDGVTGTGEVDIYRIAASPEVLAGLIREELFPLLIGRNPEMVRCLREEMLRETEYHGYVGLATFGIAAVDTALWDCVGKAHDVPCWRLWGGAREAIPAYAMVAWMDYDDDEVADVCRTAVHQGFRGVKIKVGYPTLQEDIHRVEVVRRAVGDSIALMVDANQSLSAAEAIRRGDAFARLGCLWWEEPIVAADLDGYRRLVHASRIPIATGENLFTPSDFARFLAHDAVDIVQPDMRRCGGPTAMLQIGTMAAAFGRKYASHGGGSVQMNVMACLPNAIYLETALIEDGSPFQLDGGCVQVPAGPGFDW